MWLDGGGASEGELMTGTGIDTFVPFSSSFRLHSPLLSIIEAYYSINLFKFLKENNSLYYGVRIYSFGFLIKSGHQSGLNSETIVS